MERTSCPHCGALWYIEELLYFVVKDTNGYKIEGSSVVYETSAEPIESCYIQRCLSCGYNNVQNIKHSN